MNALNVRRLLPLLALSFALAALFTAGEGAPLAVAETHPLDGKIIALDAGHGGSELGATYPADLGTAAYIYEKDVNLAVVRELEIKLTDAGAQVVLTRVDDETISSRRARVNIAIDECKALSGRKCDALISVHHNGSTDSSYDGLLVIYNEKQDLPLANAVHYALWNGLPENPNGFSNDGLSNGGYGMTVYGHLVSILTEAYYITNAWEAEQYCPAVEGGSPESCRDEVIQKGERVKAEAAAIATGLIEYFSTQGDGGNGGGGNGDFCTNHPDHRKCQ